MRRNLKLMSKEEIKDIQATLSEYLVPPNHSMRQTAKRFEAAMNKYVDSLSCDDSDRPSKTPNNPDTPNQAGVNQRFENVRPQDPPRGGGGFGPTKPDKNEKKKSRGPVVSPDTKPQQPVAGGRELRIDGMPGRASDTLGQPREATTRNGIASVDLNMQRARVQTELWQKGINVASVVQLAGCMQKCVPSAALTRPNAVPSKCSHIILFLTALDAYMFRVLDVEPATATDPRHLLQSSTRKRTFANGTVKGTVQTCVKQQGCSDTLSRLFPSNVDLSRWASTCLTENQNLIQKAQSLPEAITRVAVVGTMFVIKIGKMLLQQS